MKKIFIDRGRLYQDDRDLGSIKEISRVIKAENNGAVIHVEIPDEHGKNINACNGLISYLETFYEITSMIELALASSLKSKAKDHYSETGLAGRYDMAILLANEFEKQNIGREWDGEFIEEIEAFCQKHVW